MKKLVIFCAAIPILGFLQAQEIETFEQKITAEHSHIVVNGENFAVTYITEVNTTTAIDKSKQTTNVRHLVIDGKTFTIPQDPVFKQLSFKDAAELASGKAGSVSITEETSQPTNNYVRMLTDWWTIRTVETQRNFSIEDGQFSVQSSTPENKTKTSWFLLCIGLLIISINMPVAAKGGLRNKDGKRIANFANVFFIIILNVLVGISAVTGLRLLKGEVTIPVPVLTGIGLTFGFVWITLMTITFFIGKAVRKSKKKQKKGTVSTVSA